MASTKRLKIEGTTMMKRKSRSHTSSEESPSLRITEEITIGLVPGDVKPQKACANCRRSKVKCVHDGAPPCHRCQNTQQECKFRLRADDETWRERTDETLSKLATAVDTLLSRGVNLPLSSQVDIPSTPSSRPLAQSRSQSASNIYSSAPSSNGRIIPPPLNRIAAHALKPQLPIISPYPELGAAPDYRSPTTNDGASSSGMLSPGVSKRSQSKKREQPTDREADQDTALKQSPSSATGAPQPSSSASSSSILPPPQRPSKMNSFTLMQPPSSIAHLDQDQIMPSPSISHVTIDNTPIHLHGNATGPRWMIGNTACYAKATLLIGRDDPRMNVISIGLIDMERARSLFIHFAEKLQAHSFGFHTYPASEQMTPLIISSILMVASLHDPHSRQYFIALKHDCLASINPESEVSASHPLDPELGIGVEEIIGACIASAFLGGEIAWRISRVARWWAIGYLKHFELPSRTLTLGECLTILPPFRQIDLVDKLRIWLSAFVAEAQQAFVLDRPSLVPNQNPAPYVEALRNAFNEASSPSSYTSSRQLDARASTTEGSGDSVRSIKVPPQPDRQLMGHATLMFILLCAQQVQREARWTAETAEVRETTVTMGFDFSPQRQYSDNDGSIHTTSVKECVDRVISHWDSWMKETENWKADVTSLEDLSSSTASALDLTLSYYLVKAHLGSLALEPEFHGSSYTATAASQDAELLQAQFKIVNLAKSNALAALNLAMSQMGFRDRLVYLPGYYHFLLGHSAGFLLLLIQRKYRYLLCGEANGILEVVEQFCNIYISDIASHNFHQNAATSTHPGLATAEALSRSCQHLRAQVKGS